MGLQRLIAALSLAPLAWCQNVVIHPSRIGDILLNPGMGIQTFQRFNGDPLNEGVHWSEEGPTAAFPPGPTPDFPHSTISYCRWFWETLEPSKGRLKINFTDLAQWCSSISAVCRCV